SIQHGVVVETKSVELGSAAGGGALVGGLAGFATSSGRNSSRRVRDALIGSAIGGAVSSNAQGNRKGVQYTVDTGNGKVIVVSDQTQIEIGDCVAVENAGTGAANIRRASMALCEGPNVQEAVQTELNEDAEACLMAKDKMLTAETDEALQQAIRTARILCDD
ncbi:MAG TPA: hypothetical protein VFV10_20735, partial [Gammaproteobacteria bacterium]|nr:hypothetical protein [Gammaproteobacteria bacterium]